MAARPRLGGACVSFDRVVENSPGCRSWVIALLFSLAALAALAACSPSERRENPSEEAAVEAAATTKTAAPRPGTGVLMGSVPPASGGFPSVVILEPETPGGPEGVVAAGEPAIIDQVGMAFVPEVVVVRFGQALEFRNSEDVLHNVHVVDRETTSTVANVATPTADSTFQLTFEHPGTYEVLCDVHAAMGAFIIVTSSPYSVVAARDGTFVLPEVPYGTYTLWVWNLDETRESRRVVTVESPRTEIIVGANR